MIVTQRDGAGGHAARRQYRLDFPERSCCSARVRRVDRNIGDNRAGAFADPGLRQSRDVGALRSGQAAACMADEDDDRAVGFV